MSNRSTRENEMIVLNELPGLDALLWAVQRRVSGQLAEDASRDRDIIEQLEIAESTVLVSSPLRSRRESLPSASRADRRI